MYLGLLPVPIFVIVENTLLKRCGFQVECNYTYKCLFLNLDVAYD